MTLVARRGRSPVFAPWVLPAHRISGTAHSLRFPNRWFRRKGPESHLPQPACGEGDGWEARGEGEAGGKPL